MVQLRRKWSWVCRTIHQGTRSSRVLSPPGDWKDLGMLERDTAAGTRASEVKTVLSLGRSLSSDSGTLEGQKKREGQVTATRSKKKSKRDKAVLLALDLNLSPGEAEDEEEAVPSDLTQEGDSGSPLRMRIAS